MQPGEQSRDALLPTASAPAGVIVMHPLKELRKHPAYKDLDLTVSAAQLAALQDLGNLSLKEPLLITREGIIIDGYARRELAEKQGIATLCCVELDVDEDEALRLILDHHRRSSGWNDYIRIRMASERRTVVRTRARTNQQTGGQFKGSSKLTKANRISVRKEIANAAGVSEGSVTKVDQLRNVHPEVLTALRGGEIRIHRAWNWRLLPPEQQREQLRIYRLKRDLGRKARTLISKHKLQTPDPPLTVVDLDYVSKRLSALPARAPGEPEQVFIGLIDVPGRGVYVTKELFQALCHHERSTSHV
jgi:hypothetical protein